MESVPFDPQTDRAPIPFDDALCRAARQLKKRGLVWTPHVGCFVWDPLERIQPTSPFPHRIYFVLSLPRFLSIFGSIQAMQDDLVWLPTWTQARAVLADRGVEPPAGVADLHGLYACLLEALGG